MPFPSRPRPPAPAGGNPALPSGFDAFLRAPVGAGPDGAELSVLSMLARLDRDPWAEAQRLSAMPGAAAARALAEAVAALPDTGQSPAGADAVALRLLPLLGHSAPARRYLPAVLQPRPKRVTVILAGLVGAAMALLILLLDLPR